MLRMMTGVHVLTVRKFQIVLIVGIVIQIQPLFVAYVIIPCRLKGLDVMMIVIKRCLIVLNVILTLYARYVEKVSLLIQVQVLMFVLLVQIIV